MEQIVGGVSDGCLESDCALLGGETAILPDVFTDGGYDLAGFCVGVVERNRIIDGRNIAPGDVVIGVASSGLHSNGYSLVRKIVFELAGHKLEDEIEELRGTVGEVLLTPTRIYARAMRHILSHYTVKEVIHGIAHVSGGGILENLQRILPADRRAIIRRESWPVPPVFKWIQNLGEVDPVEMDRVFNMGLGLVLIVSPYYADSICAQFAKFEIESWPIGQIIDSPTGAAWE